MLAPMRYRRHTFDSKSLGCFFPTAEKVDNVFCFHGADIMSALTAKRKHNNSHAHISSDYDLRMGLKERIKAAREDLGLNKSELARRCGVDPSAINKLESGDTKTLSGDLLLSLSEALGTDPFILARGKETADQFTSKKKSEREEMIQDIVRFLRETDDTGVKVVFRAAQSASSDFPLSKQAKSSR